MAARPIMADRVAIVTAASRGIGAAAAEVLAERGWRLALMARSDDVETVAKRLDAWAYRGSVADAEDLAGLVQGTLDRFGRVDAVVNNTGHAARGPLLELSDTDWHVGLDLLLLNVVRMARLATPPMRESGAGAFVNISTFGAREPNDSFPVSSALRAALSAFTRMYARAHAADGIRMNDVLPGFVESYPVDAATAASLPAGRPASTREIGEAVAFLLSERSSYISGQSLLVDGGLVRGL